MTTLIYSGIGASVMDDEYIHFVRESILDVIKRESNDRFVWLSASDPQIYSAQFSWVKVKVPSHPVLKNYWFRHRLPGFLEKYEASQFISLDFFCVPESSYQQVIVWPLGSMEKLQFKRFYRKYIPKFLSSASKILIAGEGVKQRLMETYNPAPEKMVEVALLPDPVFKPISYEDAAAIREKYTGGRNYFLYAGEINADNNVIGLLKAFSLFKKRQKSDWKLLLTGPFDQPDKKLKLQFDSYKYREDVVLQLTNDIDERAQLTAAAYAVIDASGNISSLSNLLEAISSHVPVIAGRQILPPSIGLAADVNTPAEMAEKMMLLYKDEHARAGLITAASEWLSGQRREHEGKMRKMMKGE